MEWISVETEIPPKNSNGIWDAEEYLCALNNDFGFKIVTWMNGNWQGFPSGSTVVTHWMPLPPAPFTHKNTE